LGEIILNIITIVSDLLKNASDNSNQLPIPFFISITLFISSGSINWFIVNTYFKPIKISSDTILTKMLKIDNKHLDIIKDYRHILFIEDILNLIKALHTCMFFILFWSILFVLYHYTKIDFYINNIKDKQIIAYLIQANIIISVVLGGFIYWHRNLYIPRKIIEKLFSKKTIG
jgi:flagellar biosynthesis protein FlhB